MHPVPTIHNDSKSHASLLRPPTIPRKSPRKRKFVLDELVLFEVADKVVDINSIPEQNSPENLTFKILANSVQLFDLKINEETGVPAVHENTDRNLHVRLSYHGLVIPLTEWF